MKTRNVGLIGLAIAGMALALAGCGNWTSARQLDEGEFDISGIAYRRDTRTNLCFAVYAYSRGGGGSREAGGLTMTHVPCTPEVLQRL